MKYLLLFASAFLFSCTTAHCASKVTPIHHYRLGWKQDRAGVRDRAFVTHPRFALIQLPDSIDLSVEDPPVYDQGALGSCTGNGTAYVLAFAHHLAAKDSWITYSRLFIYYNERVIEGTINDDAGAEIRDGVTSLLNLGAPPETLWPYDIDCFTSKPTAEAYQVAPNYLALKAYKVDNTDGLSIRKALAAGFPVVFGCVVYPQIEDLNISRDILPMPTALDRPIGGHCMVIVGYDDKTQLFRVRNSWGPGWGNKGYCRIPYAYIGDGKTTGDCWVVSSAK
jgi:C1A family cysteine protease